MQIRAAIIIPTFDRPELLPRAILSAARQEIPPSEIIVVNDGRSAPTLPQGVQVKVANTMGRVGPNRARAIGLGVLDQSTNAICYLDDDDELLPNHLKLLSAELVKGKKFAFSRAVYRYPDGSETTDPEPSNHGPKRYYDPNALLSQNIAPVSSFMHERGASEEIGGWDDDLLRMEDWDFWGRMFIQFGPPAFVDSITNVIYKNQGPNRTNSNQYVYSMACSWRDIVADRLRFLSSKGRGKFLGMEANHFRVPRIGVVMPVYNAASYLKEAIDSLLTQTYQDFEILAVNDASTDGSRDILEQYSSRHRNLRIFDQRSNSGVTKSLNLGLLASRSELIARMDADDVCLPERFQKQVEFLDDNKEVGILGSWFWSMDESMRNVLWDNRIETSHEDISRVLPERCCIGHPTVMMKRRVIEEIGGYDEGDECKAVEDYELWLRASKKTRLANLPVHLLMHRTYDGQVSRVLAKSQEANAALLRERYGCRQTRVPSS